MQMLLQSVLLVHLRQRRQHESGTATFSRPRGVTLFSASRECLPPGVNLKGLEQASSVDVNGSKVLSLERYAAETGKFRAAVSYLKLLRAQMAETRPPEHTFVTSTIDLKLNMHGVEGTMHVFRWTRFNSEARIISLLPGAASEFLRAENAQVNFHGTTNRSILPSAAPIYLLRMRAIKPPKVPPLFPLFEKRVGRGERDTSHASR
ncbi:hypothetical protein FIBSPDRAFT_884497 [Athelia psychrophila]|uniref:Uncharacterized protein n=1 Tax=Athelia psychrophila TaxID=1759441 RepID=A0A166STZ2_9AGAM|nr:hypothetical protein FIBSPDRAFT_884497 [Fibularhizoctonia sp. CBS 109695]